MNEKKIKAELEAWRPFLEKDFANFVQDAIDDGMYDSLGVKFPTFLEASRDVYAEIKAELEEADAEAAAIKAAKDDEDDEHGFNKLNWKPFKKHGCFIALHNGEIAHAPMLQDGTRDTYLGAVGFLDPSEAEAWFIAECKDFFDFDKLDWKPFDKYDCYIALHQQSGEIVFAPMQEDGTRMQEDGTRDISLSGFIDWKSPDIEPQFSADCKAFLGVSE